MDVENSFIKPTLLFYFGKGINELEAYKEISKQYGQYAITYKTINKWFKVFRKQESLKTSKKQNSSKKQFTDEFLINLINKNPHHNMEELGKLANTSRMVISRRLKKINDGIEIVHYQNKSHLKKTNLTNKFLINLINNHPGYSMKELAKLADCSQTTIFNKLKEINSKRSSDRKVILENTRHNTKLFSNEFLISLINDNPDKGLAGLAKIANCSKNTIYTRLKKINSERENNCKIILPKSVNNGEAKSRIFTDEFLINLVNKNPELSLRELAKVVKCSESTISKRLKEVNSDGERAIYKNKYYRNNTKKFSDEFLIKLVNENPGLNMTELGKLSKSSRSTISNRLKQIDSAGDRVMYCRKSDKKFTDEFLIELINENPNLSMEELGKLAGTSRSTISNRLRQINSQESRVIYIKNGSKKFSDECLIKLINENPSYSMDDLALALNSSRQTISIRIKQINSGYERVKYIKKK
jgi:transcriptional antiterminator